MHWHQEEPPQGPSQSTMSTRTLHWTALVFKYSQDTLFHMQLEHPIEYFYSDSIQCQTIHSWLHMCLVTPWTLPWTLFPSFQPLFPHWITHFPANISWSINHSGFSAVGQCWLSMDDIRFYLSAGGINYITHCWPMADWGFWRFKDCISPMPYRTEEVKSTGTGQKEARLYSYWEQQHHRQQ